MPESSVSEPVESAVMTEGSSMLETLMVMVAESEPEPSASVAETVRE